jgi:hypothetical protein
MILILYTLIIQLCYCKSAQWVECIDENLGPVSLEWRESLCWAPSSTVLRKFNYMWNCPFITGRDPLLVVSGILSCGWVTVYRVWIGNWICWTFTDPWLQVMITVSLIHTLCSSLKYTLSLLSLLCLHHSPGKASNGGRSPSSGFPASATTILDKLTLDLSCL